MRLLVLASLGHWINYLCCVAQGAKASSHFPTAGLKKLGQLQHRFRYFILKKMFRTNAENDCLPRWPSALCRNTRCPWWPNVRMKPMPVHQNQFSSIDNGKPLTIVDLVLVTLGECHSEFVITKNDTTAYSLLTILCPLALVCHCYPMVKRSSYHSQYR